MAQIWVQDGFRFFDKNRNDRLSGEEIAGALQVSAKPGGATLQEVSEQVDRLERGCPGISESARATTATAIEASKRAAVADARYRVAEESTFRPNIVSTLLMGAGIAGGLALAAVAIVATTVVIAGPLGWLMLLGALVAAGLITLGYNLGVHEEEIPQAVRDERSSTQAEAERTRQAASREWDHLLRVPQTSSCFASALRPNQG